MNGLKFCIFLSFNATNELPNLKTLAYKENCLLNNLHILNQDTHKHEFLNRGTYQFYIKVKNGIIFLFQVEVSNLVVYEK